MLKEFRDFIARGNVLDLAVAVIIGAAFGTIATSLTQDIIMPVVGAIFGGLDFSSHFVLLGPIPPDYAGSPTDYAALKKAGVAVFGWGQFLTVVLNFLVLAFMAAVSLWTPLAIPRIAERWFSLPNFYFLWPVPVVTAGVTLILWRAIEARRDVLPFLASIALFLLGYLGLVISSYPYIVPPSLTIWDTAAAPSSQIFMLIGTVFLLPIILGYVVFIYWLFRGKVREGESYH